MYTRTDSAGKRGLGWIAVELHAGPDDAAKLAELQALLAEQLARDNPKVPDDLANLPK